MDPLPTDHLTTARPDLADALGRTGEPGSRATVPTPALLCDVDALVANITRMAGLTAAAGVGLRPHVKTHKSAFVAGLQLDHGAVGLSCAKVSEAGAVVDRLVADGRRGPVPVLVTSPLADRGATGRAVGLGRRCDLTVVVDHPDGVDALSAALGDDDRLAVLCDVDLGMGRTGVTGAEPALTVAARVSRDPRLRFAGVQGYGGHLQHIAGRPDRAAATAEATRRLAGVVAALEEGGHQVGVRSGGGTGTSVLDLELGLLSELQCGSYVFMDREYSDALGDDPEGRFAQSLTIATTVVSANQPGFVTVDAGLKAMATDAGPAGISGGTDGMAYHFFGDEHGLVTDGSGPHLRRGDRVELVPPHCDPTVDRYDLLWLVRGDAVVGAAAVNARGCSQ